MKLKKTVLKKNYTIKILVKCIYTYVRFRIELAGLEYKQRQLFSKCNSEIVPSNRH